MTLARVVLVEDDPDDQDMFNAFFSSRKDLELLPAMANGVELVDYLQSLPAGAALPDLIILDQNMPMMNGRQTLEFLKSNERFANIIAVIYSTYADSNLIIECKKLGAAMVAVKPITEEGYRKMMDSFLQLVRKGDGVA
jgi:CheY-like chemotaxis protein